MSEIFQFQLVQIIFNPLPQAVQLFQSDLTIVRFATEGLKDLESASRDIAAVL